MAIYTKKGDRGETGLYSSSREKVIRVSKSSLRIETLGCLDEANSCLGLAAAYIDDPKLKSKIVKIQEKLFRVGASLAGAKITISASWIKAMEKEIDEMDKTLPKLTNFILPGGSVSAGHLFLARTFIRRTERRAVKLSEKEKVNPGIIIFLNRLSDYVYTLARYDNLQKGVTETPWRSLKK